jgi:YggT family protein
VLIWRAITALLVVYLLLVLSRILLSWLQRSSSGRAWELLVQITDPYLSLFRRLRLLQIGLVDLSPLAAILVLVVALDLVSALQTYGRLTLGVFLAAFTGALWSGVSFLVMLFLVLVVIVFLTTSFRRGTGSPLIRTLAALIQPIIALVGKAAARVFSLRRPLGEIQLLLLTAVLLIAILIGGRALVVVLQSALLGLPI